MLALSPCHRHTRYHIGMLLEDLYRQSQVVDEWKVVMGSFESKQTLLLFRQTFLWLKLSKMSDIFCHPWRGNCVPSACADPNPNVS